MPPKTEIGSSVDASKPAVEAAPAASGKSEAQRPPKRRREDLFLGDTEAFTFDFGGPSTEAPAGATATATATDKTGERGSDEDEKVLDEDAVAAVSAVDMRRPLSLEEVEAYADAAYATVPAKFLAIPKPRRHGRDQGSGSTSETATLEEAIEMFTGGLRKYDEGLWRVDKERKRIEKERQKKQRTRM